MIAQKIKKDLIQKAKVKKAYAKIKAQSQDENPKPNLPLVLSEPDEAAQSHSLSTPAATLELHPERQALLKEQPKSRQHQDRSNSHKTSSYHKELAFGAQRRAEFAANAEARLARDRERREMAKAKRPGRDGKAKLGRQGTALLTRIQRLTTEGKI